uniref:Uncharacterized protein n=1 Tax=Anguilla anguilla TaxID=7936 RepID=A0A0E9PWP3_ANGAN
MQLQIHLITSAVCMLVLIFKQ